MNKIKNYLLLVFGSILIINMGCEPDEPNTPGNPLNGRTTAIFNPEKNYGTMTDIDGNIYKTIEIDDQVWMAENLRTTRYRNGDEIPNVTDTTEWVNLESGAFCNYRYTSNLDTIASLGRLYNWYAATDVRNIAPKGWHVPTDDEWTTLISYLGVDSIASIKLKEAGNRHWLIPAYGMQATNESGFTALPGGWREDYDGSFFNFFGGGYGVWWSSKTDEFGAIYYIFISYDNKNKLLLNNSVFANKSGYSIRCVKDK